MKFRALRADEIDVRVGGDYGKDKLYFLLYKDARCDMNILDEQVGAENWQRRHYEVKGNLFCSVGIYDKQKEEWIWKDDCGTESKTEKEKGESSDSFKRSCVNHGIGRELYTAPNIFIAKSKLKMSDDGKKVWSKLRVKDIEYSEDTGRTITRLCICDEDGNDLYSYGYARTTKAQKAQQNLEMCEGCGNPITSTTGNNNEYISAAEIVKISKEATKKAIKKEHILCPNCLKDKEVLKMIMERDNG